MVGHGAELVHGDLHLAVGEADAVAVRVDDGADFERLAPTRQRGHDRLHVGRRGFRGDAAEGRILRVAQQHEPLRRRVGEQAAEVAAGGAVDRVDADHRLPALGQARGHPGIVEAVAVGALAHQCLPAGQGVLADDARQAVQGPLQVQIGRQAGNLVPLEVVARKAGDGVGEHRRGRAGVGGVVLEAAVLKRVVAGGEVDREGGATHQHRGGEGAGGRFAGIEDLDTAGHEHVDRGQGEQRPAEAVVEADHAAARAHLLKRGHAEGRAQLVAVLGLPVEAEDGGGDRGHRADEQVLAQGAAPAGGAEGDRLARPVAVGEDFVPHQGVDPVDGPLPGRPLRTRGRPAAAGDELADGREIVALPVVVCNCVPVQDLLDLVLAAHVGSVGQGEIGGGERRKLVVNIALYGTNGNSLARAGRGADVSIDRPRIFFYCGACPFTPGPSRGGVPVQRTRPSAATFYKGVRDGNQT